MDNLRDLLDYLAFTLKEKPMASTPVPNQDNNPKPGDDKSKPVQK